MSTPLLPRRSLVAGLTVLCLLTVAAPVGAHPFIRGGELPVNVRVPVTLAMAHGCRGESGEQQSPTREVSMDVPAWLRVVETPPKEGWMVEQEPGEDGEVAVVTWSTGDPVEPAPEFVLEVVASGELGQERFLRVFQGCRDGEHRWVGTPDEPAEDPAIAVTLVAEDPERPAPDGAEEPGVGAGSDDPTGDAATGEAPADTTQTEPDPEDDATGQSREPRSPGGNAEPTTEEAGEPGEGDEPASEAGQQDDGDELAAEPADDGDAGVTWLAAALVAIAVAAGVVLLVKRRSSREGGVG